MLYEIENVSVSLGGRTVLRDISLQIRGREKIAVVGPNGCGKTTLLRLILGELEPDRDDRPGAGIIRSSRSVTVELLRQNAVEDPEQRVRDHLLAVYAAGRGLSLTSEGDVWQLNEKERYDFEAEYDRLFTGFGFRPEDKARRLGEFSGGQQTRIAMIRLLLARPDILLLDEPTNHLDMKATEWLEGYLRNYDRAVVMVSHDRWFLDHTAEWVVEIRDGRLTRYHGNYSAYRQEKALRYLRDRKRWQDQQEEIARLEDLIKRFKNKPNKAAFARSRRKILERMELAEQPDPGAAPRKIPEILPAHGCSKWVLEAEELEFGYENTLHRLDLRLRRGARLGILGSNGSGKSTLLKTLAGQLPVRKGHLRLGSGVDPACYHQEAAAIASDLSAVDYFRERYPSMTEKEIRQTLGTFGFSGRDGGKTVSSLSGGEKARLVLAILLQGRPNLLLLDEPDNHMDAAGIELLEDCLAAYRGTLVMVSHDRYFLEKTVNSLLVFPEPGRGKEDAGQGEILYYPFGYSHYAEHQGKAGEAAAARTAEEQALIEGLRSVPRGERPVLREISSESGYRDWRRRLLGEELEAAEAGWQEACALRLEERYWTDPEYSAFAEERIRRAEEHVTGLYLRWYDWELELEPESRDPEG